jgi:S1-C subfamily serine protease
MDLLSVIAADRATLANVVKVFVNASEPVFSKPWQTKVKKASTASGFLVDTKFILTNAHAVKSRKSLVYVLKHGDHKKYNAVILHVATEADLAVLTVQDDAFWLNTQSLALSDDVPNLRDAVSVLGYPFGGSDLSITMGVVSRVMMDPYIHKGVSLMRIQIDAPINPGNSGGPVMKDNRVVGVAFQNIQSAQNIGYIIPVCVVRHVLKDIERHGTFTGFPSFDFLFEVLENEQQRRSLKMQDDKHSGIVVAHVPVTSNLYPLLQKHDVVMRINDTDVANDSTVAFRYGERLKFQYVLRDCFVDDTCSLTILRDGKTQKVVVALRPSDPFVPLFHYNQERLLSPEYVIFGGVVFITLHEAFVQQEFGGNPTKPKPAFPAKSYGVIHEEKNAPDHECVFIACILPHVINMGYDNQFVYQAVKSVNGVDVVNLRHMAEILDGFNDISGAFVTFELKSHQLIVFDVAMVKATMREVLDTYQVSADRVLNSGGTYFNHLDVIECKKVCKAVLDADQVSSSSANSTL